MGEEEEIDYKALYEKLLEKDKKLREEAEKLREEAEKLQEAERKRLEEARKRLFILAKDELKRPLPAYRKSATANTISATSGSKKIDVAPLKVTKWLDFEQNIPTLLSRVGEREIERLDDISNSQMALLDTDLSVIGFVDSMVRYTGCFISRSQIFDEESRLNKGVAGSSPKLESHGGIPDVICHSRGYTLFVAEVKRVSVQIQSVDSAYSHPADAYNSTSSDISIQNVRTTILQTYSYMISKGNLKYGFFTNYEQWCFLRRYITPEGDDAVEMSKLYYADGIDEFSSARQALVCFTLMTLEDETPDLKVGRLGEVPDVMNINEEEEEEDEHEESDGNRKQKQQERQEKEFFSVGTVVDGFKFVTTKSVLNIQSLSVHAPESILISFSEKASTIHGHIGDSHLVWRQIDVYGLPKKCSDFSLKVLRNMVRREIKAYHHLRSLWGLVIPRFIYFGQDFNMLWVFVTSYEGVSLSKLCEDGGGGLTEEIRVKARNKLITLHSHGVIHGDPLLRNALWREQDQEVIWVDLEFARIFSDLTDERFTKLARSELEEFDQELSNVPHAPSKRSIDNVELVSKRSRDTT